MDLETLPYQRVHGKGGHHNPMPNDPLTIDLHSSLIRNKAEPLKV